MKFGTDSVCISADGAYVAAGACLLNREGKLLWQKVQPISSISLSADGSYLATGWGGSTSSIATSETVGRQVYFYNKDGKLLWTRETGWSLEDGGVRSVSISSDGAYVAVGGRDSKVYLYNRKGELIFHYGPEDESEGYISKSRIDAISISSDGSTIAAGTEDGRVYFFEKPK